MSKLHRKADGRYAFDDAEALKTFLSIDGKCLGMADNGARRCTVSLSKATNGGIDHELNKVNEAGFPSDRAAAGLAAVAHKCMCKTLGFPKHPSVALRHGAGARVSQEDDKYAEWNRRLWVAFLDENGVQGAHGGRRPPDLADGGEWREQLRRLANGEPPVEHDDSPPVRAGLKAARTASWVPEPVKRKTSRFDKVLRRLANGELPVKRDDNPTSPADLPAGTGLKAARTDFWVPEPPRRRTSTFDKVLQDRGGWLSGILKPLSRLSAPSQRAAENHDGIPRAHTPVPGEFPESPCPELPALHEPENEADQKPAVVGAPAPAEDKVATLENRRGPAPNTDNGTHSFLDDGLAASPRESILSTAPSATFSIGNSKFNETPDTLHSYGDPMSAAGKATSDLEGFTDMGVEATSPQPKDDSTVFDSTRQSTARHKGPYSLRSPNDIVSAGGFSAPGSGKRRPSEAVHELDTPSKPKPTPVVAAPSSLDRKDGPPGGSSPDSNFEPFWKRKNEDSKQKQDAKKKEDWNEQENSKKEEERLQYKALAQILTTLEKPMHQAQRKAGYIYIFRRDAAPGFFKIGRQTEPFGDRAKTIGAKCGYEAKLVDEWPVDAVKAIESCVHSHLAEYRHWDNRCDRLHKERAPTRKKNPCRENHKEWFNPPKDLAVRVVQLWHDFSNTRPFVNGRLDAFWRNEVVLAWDKMAAWKERRGPAMGHWEEVMRDAVSRREAARAGDPMADLALRLRVRNEGEDSVLEVFDEEMPGYAPLLSLPMVMRHRGRPGALHTLSTPPADT